MTFEVDESVVRAATRCTKDFSCLNSSGKDLCRVQRCVQGKVHFVECLNVDYCSYQMSFGTAFVCNCPIRKELYNRHKL